MSAGFYPDTSAAAFKAKSTFAFTLQVKPGKLQNPFRGPIGSASVDFQPFFNCGLQAERGCPHPFSRKLPILLERLRARASFLPL
jgi:hypothetical protein